MKKTKKIFSLLFVIIFLFLTFNIAKAEDPLDSLKAGGESAGYNTPDGDISDVLDTTIGQVIAIILGFLGTIFLILIIYSGFQWMTAGGNEETVSKAKKRLTNAVIGLVVVLAAYVITYFVLTQFYNITSNEVIGGGGQP